MHKNKVIRGLKDLIEDRKSFIDDKYPNSIYEHDIKVLEEAIKIIEAAPKGQAQEQLIIKITNLNQLTDLINQATNLLNEIKEFKPIIKIEK